MKRFMVTVLDSVTADDIHLALHENDVEYVASDASWLYEVKEEWETSQGKKRMTTKQRDALWYKCGNYNVEFNESDYFLDPATGYVEGWIGGRNHSHLRPVKGYKSTIYVGVAPDGRINS